MNWLKIISTFTLILISFAIHCPQVYAENTSNRGNSNPSGAGRSGRRVAGSDRGNNCPVVKVANKSLTALVPEPKKEDTVTISDSPTLLFYVPYASTTPVDARFSLQDEQGYNVVKPQSVVISNTPGIVRVQLPKSLEKGKVYHWYFAVICEPKNQSKNPVVDGWIRRVEPSPSLASQLTQKLSPRELAAVYKKEGILLDALALLAETRYTDMRTLDDWNSLLRSLDLEAISTEKIVQCCTPKQ